jgi:hypothetical protein
MKGVLLLSATNSHTSTAALGRENQDFPAASQLFGEDGIIGLKSAFVGRRGADRFGRDAPTSDLMENEFIVCPPVRPEEVIDVSLVGSGNTHPWEETSRQCIAASRKGK